MININGMAHVILMVSQFDKALKFHGGLLPEFGMAKVNDGPDFRYHVGARTAIGVRRCDPAFEGERFEQCRVGLHHICLRAKSCEAVDQTAALAVMLGANIVRGPEERDWTPGHSTPMRALVLPMITFAKTARASSTPAYAYLLRYSLSLISGPYIAL